jgi:hypothetical protein
VLEGRGSSGQGSKLGCVEARAKQERWPRASRTHLQARCTPPLGLLQTCTSVPEPDRESTSARQNRGEMIAVGNTQGKLALGLLRASVQEHDSGSSDSANAVAERGGGDALLAQIEDSHSLKRDTERLRDCAVAPGQ